MQSLEVISVNIWAILISLCNLLIIFLILKKFLFAPVKKVVAERQADIDGQYEAAAKAEEEALQNKKTYEEKLSAASVQAQSIIDDASAIAVSRGDALIKDAQSKADSILRTAEAEAELERKKAQADIKDEIIKEVCERLDTISRLSLEAAHLLKSAGVDERRMNVDYDPDEYILQHLQTKIELNGGGENV